MSQKDFDLHMARMIGDFRRIFNLAKKQYLCSLQMYDETVPTYIVLVEKQLKRYLEFK